MTRSWHPFRLPSALLLSVAILSCGGSDSQGPPDDGGDPVTSVSVSPSEAGIDIGESTTLTATVHTQSGADVTSTSTITWSSTASSVASVAGNGATAVVTGEDDGTATIRATASGRNGTATITVTDPTPPAAPSAVTALAASDTEIDLGWSDNSDNEEGFRIEREEVTSATGAGAADGPTATFSEVTTVGANVTSHRDAGLDPSASYRYRVRACNVNGCTPEVGSGGEADVTTEVVVTHATLVLETSELPSGVVNQAYEATLEASGGDGGHAFAVSGGELPSGLSLSNDGVLDGTPDAVGASTFTVEVVSGEQVVSREFTVEIAEEPEPPEITTSSLPDGVVGSPYSASLTAIKGDGENYVFAVIAGGLPGGLSMDAAGAITGTPTVAGQSTFTVEVTSNGETGSRELSIDVHDPLEATTGALSTGVEGVAYQETLAATGGVPPYAWTLTDGSLPPGLGLASNGTISGTPTAAGGVAPAPAGDGPAAVGTSEFSVAVTSQDGQVAEADLSITVYAPLQITTTTLPDGETASGYSTSVSASGGDASYAWNVVDGDLPDGLGLDASTGEISGTPTVAGTFTFTVEVTSGDGQAASAELSIEVVPGPPSITTTSLPDGEVGTAYSQTVAASGGDGSFTWAVATGDLPDGLGLDASTGEISGTPTAAGTFTFTLEVASAGQTASAELSIEVTQDPPSITTTSLPDGLVGAAYSQTVAATGGDGSFTWAVATGDLPDGLGLDASTGEISGTPTVAGTFNFTLRVTSAGLTDDQELSITVGSATPVAFVREVLLGAYAGVSYSDTFDPATGSGGITYSVTDGELPPGISLTGTTLSGTPTTPGMYFFEITATDGSTSDSDIFSITVSTKGPSAFNIHAHSIAPAIPSASVRTEIDNVLASYEAIITANVTGGTLPTGGADSSCGGHYPVFYGEVVDDVHVLMNIAADDGVGGRLGFAGLCGFIRGFAPQTLTGILTLDIDDLESPGFTSAAKFSLIWHEIGHIMGIGGAWGCCGYESLTEGRDGPGGETPTYLGTSGVAEYNTLQTSAGEAPLSPTVPLEGDFSTGTIDSHWDEGVFDHEIMTGFSEGGGEPISRMTIGGLEDLGWTVSFGPADPYALPACRPNCGPTPSPPGVSPTDSDGRRHLFDTVLIEPLYLLLPDGGIRRIDPIR